MAQANNVYLPGADSGEEGFRLFWSASEANWLDGLLTYVDVNSLYRPVAGIVADDSLFQHRADSMLALLSGPMVTLSGGVLSQSAPVTIDGLLPGSLWGMDLAELGVSRLLDVQRLKRVDVSVTATAGGIVEQVSPTLMPLGSDESQAL